MPKGLAAVTIQVNDETISILANSLMFKSGYGDRKVRTQTSGGGSATRIRTRDVETLKGEVTFKLASTIANIDRYTQWQELSDAENGNVIRLSGDGLTGTFQRMIIEEESEISIGVEGEFEVSFCGDPMQ